MPLNLPSLSVRHARTGRSFILGALVMAVASLGQARDSNPSEALEADIAALESEIDGLTAPAGRRGPAGPTGDRGPTGAPGENGRSLSQQQFVELALRTEALEKRATNARLRLEQLNATLVALHAVTDKLAADAETLEARTEP